MGLQQRYTGWWDKTAFWNPCSECFVRLGAEVNERVNELARERDNDGVRWVTATIAVG